MDAFAQLSRNKRSWTAATVTTPTTGSKIWLGRIYLIIKSCCILLAWMKRRELRDLGTGLKWKFSITYLQAPNGLIDINHETWWYIACIISYHCGNTKFSPILTLRAGLKVFVKTLHPTNNILKPLMHMMFWNIYYKFFTGLWLKCLLNF